ncbi:MULTISPECIES: hypothetical protein [unclassified Leeuwenhoekiella]|uniref:hypothetical protein n=1 Tax=unclassified Leeuwenhoekiella TaxID=2615029 RepID=UPI0025BFACFE|nr:MULTISPECIES: hypothetical protein [unclassified Leeuwenhoekiella]|tara:strand:+ start:22771 stop:22935 length:165 start_codon:yes stop_codon:yes gene_type:complete
MNNEHKRAAILFGILAVIALVIWLFHASFGKGLLLGVGIAILVYTLRSFLPRRR